MGEVLSTLGLGISMVLYVSGRFCKLGLPLSMFLFLGGLDFQGCIFQSQYFLEWIYVCEMLYGSALLIWGRYCRNSATGSPGFHMFRCIFKLGITTRFFKVMKKCRQMNNPNTKKWFQHVLSASVLQF